MKKIVNRLWYNDNGLIRFDGFQDLNKYAVLKFMPSGIVIESQRNTLGKDTLVPYVNLFLTPVESGWTFQNRKLSHELKADHFASGTLFAEIKNVYYQI